MASQLPLQTNPLCQNVKTNFFFVHPESIPPDLLLFDIPLTRQTIDSFLTKISKMNPTSWINPSWKKAGQCCVVLFVHLGRMMIRLWNRLIRKKTKQGECACVAQQQDAIDFLLLQNGYLAATMVAVFSLAGAAIEVTAPVENIAGRYRVRKWKWLAEFFPLSVHRWVTRNPLALSD